MSEVRSRRVWGPTLVTASTTQLLFTVPAGRTLRLSLITCTGSVAGATCALKVNGITSASAFLKGVLPSANTSLDWPFDVCLDPEDVIYGTAGATGGFYCTGFGSLLLGAPA